MKYEKQFETYEELADRVLSRGLIGDRHAVMAAIKNIGYYRLSGYWHVLKQADGNFSKNATLDCVLDIYEFDHELRLLTLSAIERIEVFFRASLAHELAEKTGPFGFLDNTSLPNFTPKQHDDFLKRCHAAFDRSREPFSIHFRRTYGDTSSLPPYWILVSTLEFGTLFSLYRGAPTAIRKEVSKTFAIEPRVLDSWLVALNTVRNICCHHGRLWNRTLGTRPALPRAKNDLRWHEPYQIRADKIVSVLTILEYMLDKVGLDPLWPSVILEHLSSRSNEDLAHMGFCDGWASSPFWARHLISDQ